jgi:hypothetical protein
MGDIALVPGPHLSGRCATSDLSPNVGSDRGDATPRANRWRARSPVCIGTTVPEGWQPPAPHSAISRAPAGLVSRRVDEFLRLPDCSCVDRPKWCRCPLGALQERRACSAPPSAALSDSSTGGSPPSLPSFSFIVPGAPDRTSPINGGRKCMPTCSALLHSRSTCEARRDRLPRCPMSRGERRLVGHQDWSHRWALGAFPLGTRCRSVCVSERVLGTAGGVVSTGSTTARAGLSGRRRVSGEGGLSTNAQRDRTKARLPGVSTLRSRGRGHRRGLARG